MTMDDKTLIERVAKGERIERGEELPAGYRSELMRLMVVFTDSELAGAAGFAEQINQGPGLRERQVAAQIVADKFDHAEKVLDLLQDFGVDPSLYVASHCWSARLSRALDLGNRRIGGDKRLNVFHYPLEGWTDSLVMNTLMGSASNIQLKELRQCSYAPLAELMQQIAQGEARHAELGERGLAATIERDGTSAAQAAVEYWYPRVAASFGRADSEHNDRFRRYGLLKHTNEYRLAQWQGQVDDMLTRLGLSPVEQP
ncbi:Phenylacetic acid catabolic protein [Marinobacterium arenosum]|uniref:Phenylacetic acid catabolic protein n=1 Tax=Marinobacterium arenosum TaxID=2862496 RepID=UPI001C9899F6|nr:Phenylacetic acid catabolic protein [Marinobacterium arenosum]MBY4678131.1 phenylacetate-CoA oxygenase subunit PaaI [Marinobacterium arenosum]